jgi:hypothetical protein
MADMARSACIFTNIDYKLYRRRIKMVADPHKIPLIQESQKQKFMLYI